MTPARGDVFMVDFDPTVGHEQGGRRPALIVSADALNRSRVGLVTVVPITGTDRGIPAHIKVEAPEAGLTKTSMIMADQLRTISLRRIGRRLGAVSTATMGQVDECIRLVLDLT